MGNFLIYFKNHTKICFPLLMTLNTSLILADIPNSGGGGSEFTLKTFRLLEEWMEIPEFSPTFLFPSPSQWLAMTVLKKGCALKMYFNVKLVRGPRIQPNLLPTTEKKIAVKFCFHKVNYIPPQSFKTKR